MRRLVNVAEQTEVLAIRQAIYAWVRDDCPITVKMTLQPMHCDKLTDRIIAALEIKD